MSAEPIAYRRNRLTPHKHLRNAVFHRDHGVCFHCGRDCEALRKHLRALKPEDRALERQRLGIPAGKQSCWECHHRIPVAEGGHDLLSNLQTLCVFCHERVTAAYAAERATRRKRAEEWRGSGLSEVFGD